MAITTITIIQDNIIGASNLLGVHCQIAFVAEAAWSGTAPEYLSVKISDKAGTLLDTYKSIPYADVGINTRRFLFIGDNLLKWFLPPFDDYLQPAETLIKLPYLEKELIIRFEDPDSGGTRFDEVLLTFAHAARQFGESVNMESLYNNETLTYYAPNDSFVYVYFYNESEANILSINPAIVQVAVNSNVNHFIL